MISSLLGKKIGMTQVYDSANCLVPVTVVEAGPCAVVQVKTTETDGYNAVQIGFSTKKSKNTSKAEQQHAAKAGLADAPRVLSEVRLTAAPTLKVGDVVTVTTFTEGQLVKEGDAIPPVFKKQASTSSTKSPRRLDKAPSIPEEESESDDASADDKPDESADDKPAN